MILGNWGRGVLVPRGARGIGPLASVGQAVETQESLPRSRHQVVP